MGGFVAFAELNVVCSTCGVLVEDALMDEALLPFFSCVNFVSLINSFCSFDL